MQVSIPLPEFPWFRACHICYAFFKWSGPLFAKRGNVSAQYLVKSRSCDIGCCYDSIAVKFDRHHGSAAADVPVEFQCDWKSLEPEYRSYEASLDLLVRRLSAVWLYALTTSFKTAHLISCDITALKSSLILGFKLIWLDMSEVQESIDSGWFLQGL